MNIYKTFPVFIFLIFIFFSKCNTTEPPPEDKRKLTLTFEDASCTEAWITLTTNNLQLPAEINITRTDAEGNSVSQVSILNTQDLLLCIDSLLPNKTYKVKATSTEYGVLSNETTFTTLDTTSHNFTWQTFTFGEHSTSVLYDVAIIDENNIWAVGEIYTNDSLGQADPNAYNAVHWNGSEWKLKRIRYFGNCSAVEYPPLRAIWVFSANDIAVTNGGSIGRFDGSDLTLDCGVNPILTGAINKIWGSNSSNLYVVGNAGNIAHYNGNTWTKIESGTDVNLTDIYGTQDGNEVWACGWNNSDGRTVLVRIDNNISEIIYDSFNPNSLPYNGFISSLWTNGKLYFWSTGVSDGAVKHSILNRKIAKKEKFGLQYFPYRIRGTGLNDISISGDAAIVWHYNGYSWKQYQELLNLDDRVRSIDMKDGIVVAAGRRYESILSTGLLIQGKR